MELQSIYIVIFLYNLIVIFGYSNNLKIKYSIFSTTFHSSNPSPNTRSSKITLHTIRTIDAKYSAGGHKRSKTIINQIEKNEEVDNDIW